MKEKKYKLTDESIEYDRHTLHRIEALKDFGNVIVTNDFKFCDKDKINISGNSMVYEHAKVSDSATINDNARIYQHAHIKGHTNISDNAHQLDEKLTFINSEVKKNDYISKRLPYPLG